MAAAKAVNPRVDWPPAGRYALAVSGGADSMVLLDLFAAAAPARGYELVVAHFDHGLRADSAADAGFVAAAARRLGLPFEHAAAGLGRASEARARAARHAWLEQVRTAAGATAILTAHHQDDLLETSLLNLARGSGRLGLAPMSKTRLGGLTAGAIARPLLAATRAQLRAYAAVHHVAWREDPTNAGLANPRNLLRHRLLAAAGPSWRRRYLALVAELAALNTKIDQTLGDIIAPARMSPDTLQFDRDFVNSLSAPQLQELILAAARALHPGIQLDRRLVTQAAAFARTGRTGTHRPLRLNILLMLKKGTLHITTNAPL